MGPAGSMFHFWWPVPVQVRTNTQTYRETHRVLGADLEIRATRVLFPPISSSSAAAASSSVLSTSSSSSSSSSSFSSSGAAAAKSSFSGETEQQQQQQPQSKPLRHQAWAWMNLPSSWATPSGIKVFPHFPANVSMSSVTTTSPVSPHHPFFPYRCPTILLPLSRHPNLC